MPDRHDHSGLTLTLTTTLTLTLTITTTLNRNPHPHPNPKLIQDYQLPGSPPLHSHALPVVTVGGEGVLEAFAL